ncbi:class I SAM-dependent methyltransferase family protein [Methanolobus sp. ZRKC3]|uniref:class I SAM-dependent methyltransferase n=1 Tax=Methanolobus sp. ZRKC3 TaxID=3125786 RepID=UPI00325584E0
MKKDCIKVSKQKGEPVRRLLLELELLDNSAKINSDPGYLYLPLTRIPDDTELELLNENESIELSEADFEEHEGIPRIEDLLENVPHFEIVGDIVLIESDVPEPEKVADAIMTIKPNVKTVLAAISPVEGEFRTRRFKTIAGENRTWTTHKEYGCRYHVDLEKAYFTPRLATERARIVKQINEGETVVDMFAGVGPYSIPIAKNSPAKKVIAIDKNPFAVEFLRKNIELNSVEDIEAIEGDANIEAEKFAAVADHVIMNLPHNAHQFLDAAIKLCAPQATIHYYDITPDDDLFEGAVELIGKAAENAGRSIEIIQERVVRSYAPHQYNVCIEVKVL